VDVRVAAATHQDLEQLIRAGRFREDLYYRLNVISIPVPPLRDRREDIPELVQHFLARCCQRAGKRLLVMDDEALLALKGFAWPGNIRQLENAIERGVVAAEGAVITLADLPPEIERSDQALEDEEDEVDTMVEELVETASGEEPRGVQAERADRDRREREQLVRALASTGGNKAEAARALGLARSTFVSRLKKHGLS
jgi:DNA-binding NtrC family response regulator